MDDQPFTAESEVGEGELWWRDHSVWLEKCGYRLRARYQPGWTPSWKTILGRASAEDGILQMRRQYLDAIRTKDGAAVGLKRIFKSEHPDEAMIFGYFSSEPVASDPRNHGVPLLETLHPPDNDGTVIFVMPLLRDYNSPKFDTIGEAVEFFRQIFEGLHFMHQHRVAHRDCNFTNIMMDGQVLYPLGFHPQRQTKRPSFRRWPGAIHYTGTQRPVRYLLIDFGISTRFEPGEDVRVPVIVGGDKSPPEFKRLPGIYDPTPATRGQLLDPFPIDVYYLGNLIRMDFLDGFDKLGTVPYMGFEFMRSLVNDMVQPDPAKRPTMDEVVVRFEEIRMGLSTRKLRSRAIKADSGFDLSRIISHWCRRTLFVLLRVPALPSPDG
ncbi:hypothetical protein C8R46DRAFT_1053062 [Mycena filopes]|nr:hypothetical protein C8R46DRAFT_1053062 [Mycena filopes]